MAHRLFLLVLGYSLLVLSLVLLLVTSKNFHSKEIDAAKVCRWDQSSNSATEIFYSVDPSGAVVCVTQNTSNVKKAEHYHRPEMFWDSVQNRPSHIWQFEQTKRLFYHVAIY